MKANPAPQQGSGTSYVQRMLKDFERIGKGDQNYALYKLLQQFLGDYHRNAEPWGEETEYGASFNTDQFCKDYAEALLAWRDTYTASKVLEAVNEIKPKVITGTNYKKHSFGHGYKEGWNGAINYMEVVERTTLPAPSEEESDG